MPAEGSACIRCGGATAPCTAGEPSKETTAYQQRGSRPSSATVAVSVQQIYLSTGRRRSAGERAGMLRAMVALIFKAAVAPVEHIHFLIHGDFLCCIMGN